MYPIVVGKLSDGNPFVPVVLQLVDEESKELFDFLVDSFGLSTGLWVVGCRGCDFDPKELAESLHEVGDELGSSITDDFLWEAMELPDAVPRQAGDS